MPEPTSGLRELQILEQIEADPNVTQAGLANQLGVAVGTINFVVKRLVKKGYVRVTQLQRRRLKYIITPEGVALRTKLAVDSLEYSMRLYRETRAEAKRLIGQARQRGFRHISIRGNGELAEVVELTCREMGVEVRVEQPGEKWPVIAVVGAALKWEEHDAG